MILRLTDGTTTVSMMGGPIYRQEYAPRAPKLQTLEYNPGSLADGGEAAAITRANVVETCQVTVVRDTPDEVRTSLQSIEDLFLSAIEYQSRRGAARVYVEFAAEDDDDVYRSEILYGRLEPGITTLSLWPDAGVEATLTWKRRFYWEGPEAELSLSNTHGSGAGGVTVYNHYDASNENFVDITGADVGGVLPAPIRLEMTNTYNVATRLYDIFVGLNVYSSPSSLDHILEGEDAITPSAGGTVDADCSGGYYKSSATLTVTRGEAMAWTLSAATLGHCGGRWFRLLMRVRTPTPSGVYVLPKLTFPPGSPLTVVAEADEVALTYTAYLQDIGVVQIPPWLQGLGADLYPIDLTLYGRMSSGSAALDVDFLQMTPMDGYRVLSPRGYGASYDVRVADDGIGGWIWTDGWSGSQKTGHYYGLGLPIQLMPGRNQRLYFMMKGSGGQAEILRTLSVRVYYRPRRGTM